MSKREASADLNQAIELLFEYHPDFPSFTDSLSVRAKQQQIEAQFGERLTVMEFYSLASQLNEVIHCVHTDLVWEGPVRQWKTDQAKYPPFSLEAAGGEYYINFSADSNLHAGDKVLAINGIPIDSIANQIVARIPADGLNKTRKYHSLSRSFPSYYTKYVDPTPNQYQLQLLQGGIVQHQQVDAISYREHGRAIKKQRSPFETYRNTIYPEETKSLAWLQQFTFRGDLIKRKEYEHFLDSFFTVLNEQDIRNLVIDVRGNGGGYSEYAQLLLQYLVADTFQYAQRMILKKDSFPKDELLDIPQTFLRWPQGISSCPTPNGRKEYQWNGHKILETRAPWKNRFSGRLIILTNGGSVSTSAEFASLVKQHTDAIFIGEEMGGKFNGDNGGVLAMIPLTNSGMTIRIPLVKYELGVDIDSSGHGVQPDISVSTLSPSMENRFRWDPHSSHPENYNDPYVLAVWKYLKD